MNIYQQNILDHYKNPKNFGRIKDANKSSTKANPSCGDNIVMDVVEKDGRIKDIKFEGTGCAISVASASMLTEKVKSMTKQEIQKLDIEDIKKMLGIEISTGRYKCANLSLDVLKRIVK